MKKTSIILILLSFVLAGCSGKVESQVRSFDGVKISYDVQGTGQPVLVFVHGWSCNKEYWKEQLAHFAKKHKVVTIDLAGHGQSDQSRKDYTVESFGKDVAGVVKKLNLDQAILIGHSMGGPVIIEAAGQMPDRVICLVGADTFHDIEKGYPSAEIEKIATRFEADFAEEAQSFVRQMFPPTADPELVEWVAGKMSSANPEVGINAFKNLGKYDLKSAAQEMEIPIYSISADLWPVNLDANKKYAKTFKLKLMPGVGHFVMLEDPERFNKLLEEIIEELYKIDLNAKGRSALALKTIEEDRKNHGHMDGHAVMVLRLLEDMNLDEDVITKCREVARASQNEYRRWYSDNKGKVDEFNKRIRALKAEGNRGPLKKILPEKKEFMHTAPSLLRNPEPIESVLGKEEYAVFLEKLNELRISLHKPGKK